jgi:hypothetical protein
MTVFTAQPHAAMDRFPAFLASIRGEFPDDCEAIAAEMIDAELGDFCWESRIAERRLGMLESFGDEAFEAREEVTILGYFRGKYLVATCVLDGDRRLCWMRKVREFAAPAEAESAFMAPS